jgi:hypothetical protein
MFHNAVLTVTRLYQAFVKIVTIVTCLKFTFLTSAKLMYSVSSITGTNDLVKQLLPTRFRDFWAVDEPVYCSAEDEWLA